MTPPAITRLSPHLHFEGQCREAMLFYHSCLGGTLTMTAVCDSPLRDQWPAEHQSKILHALLECPHFSLMAADVGTAPCAPLPSCISLTLTCGTEEELTRYFNALAHKGEIVHRLHQFFDGIIGAVTDQYGIHWILKF
jgi:PhnB protein